MRIRFGSRWRGVYFGGPFRGMSYRARRRFPRWPVAMGAWRGNPWRWPGTMWAWPGMRRAWLCYCPRCARFADSRHGRIYGFLYLAFLANLGLFFLFWSPVFVVLNVTVFFAIAAVALFKRENCPQCKDPMVRGSSRQISELDGAEGRRCSDCNAANRAFARFCARCGRPFPLINVNAE